MTPAINLAKKFNINFQIHQYTHDVKHKSYGLEAAQKLNVDPAQVFKTIVLKLDNNTFAVGVIPVNLRISLKLFAKAANAKKSELAPENDVVKLTGYILGGVSPIGQKKRLLTIIDISAEPYSSIFVSAGKRGLEIELAPNDLKELVKGSFKSITQTP